MSAIVCCIVAKINDLWDGSMDQRMVRGLIPCCGQDGYRAQVPQHPIDSSNISQHLFQQSHQQQTNTNNSPLISFFYVMFMEHIIQCRIVQGKKAGAVRDIRILCTLLEGNPMLMQNHRSQLHTLLGNLMKNGLKPSQHLCEDFT